MKQVVPSFHASADSSKNVPLDTKEKQEKDQGPGWEITVFV